MPMEWYKGDYFGLSRRASERTSELLSLGVNVTDLIEQRKMVEVVEAIYSALLAAGINYSLEPIPRSERDSSSSPIQFIRTPSEILSGKKREGTCLDLSLLFCGACLGYGLLPVLIVLDGHALVAVSQTLDLRRWHQRVPREYELFMNVIVGKEKAEDIRELIVRDSYLAVECTGFARGASFKPGFPEGIGREPDGAMSFARATAAGKQHFDRLGEREFLSAIDYGTFARAGSSDPRLDADTRVSTPRAAGAGRAPDYNPLPYLLDRSEQEEGLRRAALEQRARARQRPLVCVIHGDELECHEEFLDRLQKVSLPKILSFWRPQEGNEPTILRILIEPSLDQLTSNNWETVLWGDLAAGATNSRDTPRDAVVNLISQHKPAVLIDAPLLSEKLEGVSLDQLDLFFKFWDEWPNLADDLLLVVCLSLKYQPRFDSRWLPERWSLNGRLRRYVGDLDFAAFRNIQGVCLPELEAIAQSDAAAAVRHAHAQSCGLKERHVIKIYNQHRHPNGRIPMCHLLDYLEEATP